MSKLTLILFLFATSGLTYANIISDIRQVFGLPDVIGTEYYNYSFETDLRGGQTVTIGGQRVRVRSKNPKRPQMKIGKCITVRKTYYSEGPSKLSFVRACPK